MKSLFVNNNDNGDIFALTSKGREVKYEVECLIRPLIDKWVELGYSPHEIFAVVFPAIDMIISRQVIERRDWLQFQKTKGDMADIINEELRNHKPARGRRRK